ncbi:MAG: Uma2 family endonuclease [Planctomycetota bacterium]
MAADPQELSVAREYLRGLSHPFLLRAYNADPEDFEKITDEDFKCEYLDGELIVHSPASLRHEDVAAFLLTLLRTFVSNRRLGHVFGSNAVMQIDQRRLCPDVSFLSETHAERMRGGRLYGPFDLVAEILSTSTRDYDTRTKLPVYREARVREIWLIDPDRRQFEAHVLRGESYSGTVLPTGRWRSVALPGFSVAVDWFWADPLPAIGECATDA